MRRTARGRTEAAGDGGALLELLGVPVLDWIGDLLDRVGEVPPWAIVAGVALESAQTSLAALAWYGIA